MKSEIVSMLKEIVQGAEIWNEGKEIPIPPILDFHSALYISVIVILFGEWFAGFRSVTLLVLKVPKKPIMLVNGWKNLKI